MEWQQAAVLVLHMTHYLSVAVWVGVMLFNLIVNFPALRERAATPVEFASAMAAQARRAGPWLYALVALTLASGLLLHAVDPGTGARMPAMVSWLKGACIGLMLALHLYGSLRLWPQIHFALDSERPGLLLRYQLAMVGSSALGLAAIGASYWTRAMLLPV